MFSNLTLSEAKIMWKQMKKGVIKMDIKERIKLQDKIRSFENDFYNKIQLSNYKKSLKLYKESKNV